MREKIAVLYYPDFWADYATLVKEVLLFDELHFMDRASMMFGDFGTIGAASPLRQFEASFRDEGVPFYVHPAPMGPVTDQWYEDIKADVNDPEFLKRFQNGLRTSPTFRRLQVVPGNYGEYGNEESVARRLMVVDLSAALEGHESPVTLFEDSRIRHFDLSTPVGCAKQLISDAMTCSAKLNFALNVGTRHGFLPLADASPFGDLLGAKYARALNKLQPAENKLQMTDLSFAIFDELIPPGRLEAFSLKDAVRYRKASEKAREEFLEHLSMIQVKQATIGINGDYTGAIRKLIDTEIRPAVATFKKKLRGIDESLFGAIAKGAVGAASGSSAITLFGDLSWQRILAVGSMAAAYVTKALIDAYLAERTVKRECGISYLLSLDD
jgi:hypothetical protein